MSCCHHQCSPKKRAAASPTNSLASGISFILFTPQWLWHWCLVETSWSYRRGVRCFCGMMLLCTGILRDKKHRLSTCSLELTTSTGTHISMHRQACILKLRKMHLVFCLVPLAGSWGHGEWGSSPVKQPLQLPVLNMEKTTLTMCSPFPSSSLGGLGETWLPAAYCGVVPPCWQGLNLHLKAGEVKSSRNTSSCSFSCACWQTPPMCPTSELPAKPWISQPLDWLFFGLSSHFPVQGCAFSEESLNPLQG